MIDNIFWIWMQEALGIGSIKVDRALNLLGSPETLYNMTERELSQTGIFAPKEVAKIKFTGLEHAKENQLAAKRYGCRIVTPDQEEYPDNLANIACLPCVLYVLGGSLVGLNDDPLVTMVGTRGSTDYGTACADRLAFGAAAAGCTVVSGLAVGIDYASHEGALRAGGRSIGLLACGINVDYPAASRGLKRRILDSGGALISEFKFGETAHPRNFNIRNRILSGISVGCVVVQAPLQSGALNTARHALEQNRDVFAVPGGIFDPTMAGCNRLLREGAKIVLDAECIVEEYVERFPGKLDIDAVKVRETAKIKSVADTHRRAPVQLPFDSGGAELPMVAQETSPALSKLVGAELENIGLSSEAEKVYACLGQQPAGCELLAAKTGLSAAELGIALTELEMSGIVRVLPGKQYLPDCPRTTNS